MAKLSCPILSKLTLESRFLYETPPTAESDSEDFHTNLDTKAKIMKAKAQQSAAMTPLIAFVYKTTICCVIISTKYIRN